MGSRHRAQYFTWRMKIWSIVRSRHRAQYLTWRMKIWSTVRSRHRAQYFTWRMKIWSTAGSQQYFTWRKKIWSTVRSRHRAQLCVQCKHPNKSKFWFLYFSIILSLCMYFLILLSLLYGLHNTIYETTYCYSQCWSYNHNLRAAAPL